MTWLVPVVAFVGTALVVALLAWWSGAWRSLLGRAGAIEHDDGHDPEELLRSADANWIQNHEFWKTSEMEEIAL